MKHLTFTVLTLSALSLAGVAAGCRDSLPPGPTNSTSEGAIARYSFDGDASDRTGNHHDGTLNGATFTADRFGNANSALHVDGKSFVTVPNASDLEFTGSDSYSIAAWVRTDQTEPALAGIVCKGPLNNHYPGYELCVDTTHALTQISSTDDLHLSGTTDLTDGSWHFLTMVVQANRVVDLYVDGNLEASQQDASMFPELNNNAALLIGAERNMTQRFIGDIDDIAIYKHALSTTEITDLYHTGGWTGPTKQNNWTTQTLTSARFVSTNEGYVVGFNGTILHTTNAGNQWSQQSSSTLQNLYEVSFAPGTQTGVAVGNAAALVGTTDGGTTWTSISTTALLPQDNLRDVRFLDANTVVAVGGYNRTEVFVIRSDDAGKTWTRLPGSTSTLGNGLYAISGFDANRFWVAGLGGILATTDGGKTWLREASTGDFLDIDFYDLNHGVAVGFGGALLVTSDGGVTWNSSSTTTTDIRNVHMVNPSEIWACGSSGLLMESTDGGITWSSVNTGVTSNWNGMGFRDATHALLVGDNGTYWWKN